MKFSTRDQMVALAKLKSPFYRKFYEGTSSEVSFHHLPVATVEEVTRLCQEQRLTFHDPSQAQGVCFSSSGTTGFAKGSFFDVEEWKTNNTLIANTHLKNGLIRENDIVANLAYAGHASFMAVHGVMQSFPVPCAEIAIGADRDFAETVELCEQFKVTVITGVYSAFLGLADHLIRTGQKMPLVHALLGGGELLYGAQAEMIKSVFPNAKIMPFIYGATDSGLIGYGDVDGPISHFYIYNEICYAEIVDPQTHEVIVSPNKPGLLVITNLHRKNAPVVRYCNGDIVQWLEAPQQNKGHIEYLGRTYPATEVQDNQISAKDIEKLILNLEGKIKLSKIQMQISEEGSEVVATVFFSTFRDKQSAEQMEKTVREQFLALRPDLSFKLKAQLVDFSYFWSQVRKRGKLFVDARGSL